MLTTARHSELYPEGDAALRANIGFVLSAEDTTFESDIRSIQLEGVEWFFSRMAAIDPRCHPLDRDKAQALIDIEQAIVALKRAGDVDVASFAAGCLCAVVGNDRIIEAVRVGTGDALVSSVHTASKRAVKAIQAKHVAIATGYDAKINNFIADAFAGFGVDVVSISGIGAVDTPRGFDFSHKSPREVRDFALSLDRADADAIVISSTTMRAMEVIDELEQIAGKPVICSNQIAIWDALRSAGISDRIPGYGSLLQRY